MFACIQLAFWFHATYECINTVCAYASVCKSSITSCMTLCFVMSCWSRSGRDTSKGIYKLCSTIKSVVVWNHGICSLSRLLVETSREHAAQSYACLFGRKSHWVQWNFSPSKYVWDFSNFIQALMYSTGSEHHPAASAIMAVAKMYPVWWLEEVKRDRLRTTMASFD